MFRHSISRTTAAPAVPAPRGATLVPGDAAAPVGGRTALALSTGAHTLGEMLLRAGERDGIALRYKEAAGWRETSYRALVRSARDIAKGLIALGINPGERVSILADTRPEWTVADAACFLAGTVVTPIYQTNSPEECEYVLRHCDARAVFCEDAAQLAKIEQIRDRCPALQHVITFAQADAESIDLDGLIALGADVREEEVDARAAAASPEDMASLVYTSGTTGPPKGCILTHRNFISASHAFEDRVDLTRHDAPIEVFLFLPLAHVYARLSQVLTLDVGGTLIYWQRDAKHVLDEMHEARPTSFPSVPRVWEKIYTAAASGIAEQPRAKRALFEWALDVGHRVREHERRGGQLGPLLSLEHRFADRLVLSKVRDLFGGRLEVAITGAAPIGREVLEFFDACGMLLVEGWGMTETCSVGTINTDLEMKIGTVGRPIPPVQARIASDGELLVRGPNIFRGYFKDEHATRETLTDGWLATGDLASIDADGYVSITGRKKDLIITSSGKNITAANIENALKQTRWISEAVAYGDRRPYLVALLTLDPDEAPKLAQQLGISADITAMATDERVRAQLQYAIDAVNDRFARIEQIKRFAILDRELTQEQGELTPTLKVKRSVVYDKFATLFDGLYAE